MKMNSNINNFYGNVDNSQIQQNTNNSMQNISVNEDYNNKEELSKYILSLKENINKLGLEKDEIERVLKSTGKIENELKKENTKTKVISECLETVRNVLEGVTGSLIASGLIYQLNSFF